MTSNEHLKSICIIQIFHKPFFAPYFVAKKCTNHVFVLPQLSPPFPAAGRSIRSQLLGVFLVEYVIYGSDVVPGQTSLSASEHTGKRNCKKKWRCALAVWRRHFHDNWDALDCPRNKWGYCSTVIFLLLSTWICVSPVFSHLSSIRCAQDARLWRHKDIDFYLTKGRRDGGGAWRARPGRLEWIVGMPV